MNTEDTLREEWNKDTSYLSGREKKGLACCGGDYCVGDHNKRIADYWLTKCRQELTALRERVEKLPESKWRSSEDNYIFDWKFEVLTILDQMMKK